MCPTESERIARLPGKAESLLRRIADDVLEVEQSYPSLQFTDTRRAALHKLANALSSAHLNLLLLHEQLFDPSWWVGPGRSMYSPDRIDAVLEGFENHAKFGLLMGSFSATESSLRIVANAICPRPTRGHEPFNQVYGRLFGTLCMSAAATVTFELYRNLRNACHNNSVHVGQTVSVEWRGSSYEFRDGQPVSFLTWDVLFDLVQEVSRIIKQVMTHPQVRAVASMTDLYAN